MKKDYTFRVKKAGKNEIQFITDEMTITIDSFVFADGKHQIASPAKARARFVCCESNYLVENSQEIPTVEDWYEEELLPKIQMLALLMTN